MNFEKKWQLWPKNVISQIPQSLYNFISTLVYFENGVPELYPGDLLNDDAILKWMLLELKQEEIKELTVPMLGMASNKMLIVSRFGHLHFKEWKIYKILKYFSLKKWIKKSPSMLIAGS